MNLERDPFAIRRPAADTQENIGAGCQLRRCTCSQLKFPKMEAFLRARVENDVASIRRQTRKCNCLGELLYSLLGATGESHLPQLCPGLGIFGEQDFSAVGEPAGREIDLVRSCS